MPKHNPSLNDVIEQRTAVRDIVLGGRRKLAQLEQDAAAIAAAQSDLKQQIAREAKRLVELTTLAASLLHADLSGVVGKTIQDEEPAAEVDTTHTTSEGVSYQACVL